MGSRNLSELSRDTLREPEASRNMEWRYFQGFVRLGLAKAHTQQLQGIKDPLTRKKRVLHSELEL